MSMGNGDGTKEGGGLPDYREVEIPEDKPPEEFTYHERRAEILQEFEAVGYVKEHELAARFDVGVETIRKDMRRIEEAVNQ